MLGETQENRQCSCVSDLEEIANLKATIVAKNLMIDELELASNVPDDKVNYKCGKCGIASGDNDTLKQHMKSSLERSREKGV